MTDVKIPVRNLWLLMLYGSDLAFLNHKAFVAAEKNPEKLPDLITELLCEAVEGRLRNGLTLGFRSISEPLPRVRGRIDFLNTYSRRLLDHGRVHCEFERISPDTEANRFVLSALKNCLPMLHEVSTAIRCRKCIHWMSSLGVAHVSPRGSRLRAGSFDRSTASDRLMLSIAALALEMKIPSEGHGEALAFVPKRDERWLRTLFEKAVAGYYRIHTLGSAWKVSPGKWLNWQIDEHSDRIPELLPKMKTDIYLENPVERSLIIIDTKFNQIIVDGRYRDKSFRSSYVYQMYAYTKSQPKADDAASVEGVLLHPSFGQIIDESVVIQGDRFRFMTLDLLAEHGVWAGQLSSLIGVTPRPV